MDQEQFQKLLLDNSGDIIRDLGLNEALCCPVCIINDIESGECFQDSDEECEYIEYHDQIIEKLLKWSADAGFELFEKYNSIFNPNDIYIKEPYNWLMEYILTRNRNIQLFDQTIPKLVINPGCSRFLTYTKKNYFLGRLIQAGIEIDQEVIDLEMCDYLDRGVQNMKKIKLLMKYGAIMDAKAISGMNFENNPEKLGRLKKLVDLGLDISNEPKLRKARSGVQVNQKIVSQIFGYILYTETGRVKHKDGHRVYETNMPLTGCPLMLAENVLGYLEVHYCDHIDRFRMVYDSKLRLEQAILDDPTYLGTCFDGYGSCTYNRINDDLVCTNPEMECRRIPDFFQNCWIFLYVTNAEMRDDEPYVGDYLPHYVDVNGTIHGRNPDYFIAKTREANFTILYDVNLCVFNDYGQVCIIYGPNLDQIYNDVCMLNISKIEIYPNVCQIFTADGVSYVLDEDGLDMHSELRIVVHRSSDIKSARNV